MLLNFVVKQIQVRRASKITLLKIVVKSKDNFIKFPVYNVFKKLSVTLPD